MEDMQNRQQIQISGLGNKRVIGEIVKRFEAEQSGDVDFSLLIEQIEDTGTAEELSSTVAIELADMVRAEEAAAE